MIWYYIYYIHSSMIVQLRKCEIGVFQIPITKQKKKQAFIWDEAPRIDECNIVTVITGNVEFPIGRKCSNSDMEIVSSVSYLFSEYTK